MTDAPDEQLESQLRDLTTWPDATPNLWRRALAAVVHVRQGRGGRLGRPGDDGPQSQGPRVAVRRVRRRERDGFLARGAHVEAVLPPPDQPVDVLDGAALGQAQFALDHVPGHGQRMISSVPGRLIPMLTLEPGGPRRSFTAS